jgi:hypothetical protein
MSSIYKNYLKECGYDIDAPFVLDEVYFGKNKYLTDAEKVLGQIRTKYIDSQAKVNSAKELLEFNRLMEQAFKFDTFCLNIKYLGNYNAYTYPIANCIDAPNYKNMKSDKEGFNYNYTKGSSIIVWMHSGLLFAQEFSDAELMAIILHEIGHNFQQCISPFSRGFSYIGRMLQIILVPVSFLRGDYQTVFNATTGTRRWYTDLIKRWREEDDDFFNFLNCFRFVWSKIIGAIGVAYDSVNVIMRLITGPAIPAPTIQNAITIARGMLSSLPGVKNESIADNFVTAYGYGPELTSALTKMKKNCGGMVDQKFVRSIPLIGTWYDFCEFPMTMVYSIISDHPDNAYRCKSQIDMLKKELDKSDVDPKMKGKIREEVREIEKTLDSFTADTENGFEFTNAWSAFLLTIANGDLRSWLGKNNAKEFDAAYDRNLEAVKRARQGR